MRKSVVWAALAGVAVTWLCYQALAPTGAPLWLARLIAGGDLDELSYHGGIRVRYRLDARAADAATDAAIGPDQVREAVRHVVRRAERVGRMIEVAARDRDITLAIGGITETEAETMARLVTRHDQLRVHRAIARSELMARLYQRAAAQQGPVQGLEPGCAAPHDWYLIADTRAELEAFVSEAARENSRLRAEPGRRIMFAQQPLDVWERMHGRTSYWRAYYTDSTPVIENRDIDSAEGESGGRPMVMLRFSRQASQRWREFASSNRGAEMLIVVDGIVIATSFIHAPEGTMTFPVNTAGPDSGAEAKILARSLMMAEPEGPARDWALTITSLDHVPRRMTWDQLRVARGLYALLLGLAVFGLVLVIDPWVSSRAWERVSGPAASAAGGERTWPVVPLLVTLGAAMAVYFCPDLSLPAVDGERASMLPGGQDSGGVVQLNPFALGIMPIVSAFLLVELAALIVPAWRPLRHGGPAARARLGRATLIVSLLLAQAQGYFIVHVLAGTAVMGWDLVPDPGLGFVAVATLTLSAGALMCWIVAALVSRHGMGNGFAVIMIAGLLGQTSMLHPVLEPLELGSVDMALVVIAVPGVMLMTSALLRVRVAGLSLPTCGMAPILYRVEHVAVLIVLAVLLSWLFLRSASAGAARLVRHGNRPRLWFLFRAAVAVSTAYLLGASVAHGAAPDRVIALLPLPAIIMLTAFAMDLLAEWRARRRHDDLISVWPMHQVHAVDLALSALRGAGIDAHARGRYFRALFHFFAPFVAIDILVPSARADDARDILAGL